MQSELAFFTTQELIDELMSRKTFLGVVIHSQQEFRGRTWGDRAIGESGAGNSGARDERMFKVHYNANLDQVKAARLLDTVAEYMDLHCT